MRNILIAQGVPASKGDSRIRLETLLTNQASNSDIIARVRQDMADFESRQMSSDVSPKSFRSQPEECMDDGTD